MRAFEYTVRFNTPAFLGNAEQSGQWRTPPFKAQLRQWWRVVKARVCGYQYADLRRYEGDLFGNAWLKADDGKPLHRKSRIALRLGSWHDGTLTTPAWPGGAMESVVTTRHGKGRVRVDVYLGYGPVLPPSKKENRPTVNIRDAIGTDDESRLVLLPERQSELRPTDEDIRDVLDAVQLMAWFGTLGSRARNGWGSLSLAALGDTPAIRPMPGRNDDLLKRIGREWTQCLALDWPHALGFSGNQPLVWISRPQQDWRKVMGCLANIRVELRAVAKTYSGPDKIGGIHLLGYPAGNKWTLRQFSKGQPTRDHQEARLATQLRFKVVRTEKGFIGLVYHMPHGFPAELMNRLNAAQRDWLRANEQRVWHDIHRALNHSRRLVPLGES